MRYLMSLLIVLFSQYGFSAKKHKVQEFERTEFDFVEKVEQLQQDYETLCQIFNAFATCVDHQGEQLEVVMDCCQSTFENTIQALVRMETLHRKNMSAIPWAGYSAWAISGLTTIGLVASGGWIPAAIVAGVGGSLGLAHVGYMSYQQRVCREAAMRMLRVKHAASDVLTHHVPHRYAFQGGVCPHAGVVTAQELLRQQSMLLHIEKVFDQILTIWEPTSSCPEENMVMAGSYIEADGSEDSREVFVRIQHNLQNDENLAQSFTKLVDDQKDLLDRLLEKSARLNGHVMMQMCRADAL